VSTFVPLGELVDIKTGKLDANAAVIGGKYPFFTCSKDISWIDTAAYEGDVVLVAGNGDLNVKHYKGKFNAYQRTYILKAKNNKLLSMRFLYHFMSKYVEVLRRQSIGGVIKYIKLGNLSEAPFPKVTIEEQRRIAAILDKADAIRQKRKSALTLADTFLRASFLDMFGDPVTNPMGWDEISLDHLAAINSGLTKGRKLAGRETVELPYMRVANVQDGHLNLDEVKEITLAKDEVEKFLLKAGDVLLTEGGDPDKLGRGAVWKGEIETCVHQNHIFRVTCKPDFLDPEFASAQIGSVRGKKYFLRSAKQTTGIATINKTQLREFPMLLPPLALQRDYASIVERTRQWKEALYEALAQAETLFASLSQRAFKGEL